MHPYTAAELVRAHHADLVREAEHRRLLTQVKRGRRSHHQPAPVRLRSLARRLEHEVRHLSAPTFPGAPSRWVRRVAAAVAAALYFGTAACSSTASSGVDSAFLARIDHECAVGNTYSSLNPFPYPTFDPTKPVVKDLPGVANYFRHSPDVVNALLGLGTPAEGVAGWQRVVASLKDYATNQKKQIAAAAASDPHAFVATVATAATTQHRLLLASTQAGLTSTSCNTYFGG